MGNKFIRLTVVFVLMQSLVAVAQRSTISGRQGTSAVSAKKGVLNGLITDVSTGKPLAGASVYVPDLRKGTVSNKDGRYEIKHMAEGTYVIDITFQGYASLAVTVVINGDTKRNFELKTTVAENENVIVTGVSKASEMKRMPMSVSVVKKQELYRSSATNIIDALARKAGVSAVSTGPAIAKPFIRGLGFNRVITLNDGLRQEGQQWGDEHGIELDEYSVQRAEILRGPASLMYGSDGLGGVLNIISHTPISDGHMKANVVESFNGNNNMWGHHANIAGSHKGFEFNAYGSRKLAGDYQNKYDGNVLNSRFREANFGAHAELNRKWGYTALSVSNFDQRVGMVEGDRDAEGRFLLFAGTPQERLASAGEEKSKALFVPSQRIRHFKLAWDNSVAVGRGRLNVLLGYQHNRRQEFGEVDTPELPVAFFDLPTLNYNIAYHLADKNGWKTTVGSTGMRQVNRNKAEEAIIPDYHLWDAGLYVFTQKTWKSNLTFSGGLRADIRQVNIKAMQEDNGDTKFDALQKDFSNISGSIGASYLLKHNWVLKANLSRGFRAPNAFELSANGEHEGTNRYEIGKAGLTTETSLQTDLSLEWSNTHMNFSVSPFYNHINRFIFSEKLNSVSGGDSLRANEHGEMITAYQSNQQSANLAGFEFSFDLHPHPFDWLHFENTISLVRGRFTKAVDGSYNLPMIAPARWLSELRAEWAKPKALKCFENAYVKAELDVNARQQNAFTGYHTETNTPSYVLLNLGWGTDVVLHKRKWASLHFALNNLTDVAYQSHLSRFKYLSENPATGRMGVFNMGRNFTARLVVPLEWTLK